MLKLGNRPLKAPLLAAIALCGAGSVAASGAIAAASVPERPSAPGATTITSWHTKAGRVLVGPHGQVLFLFNQDQRGTSTCYGRCAREWPPLRASGRLVAKRGSGVKQRWLSTMRRRGGMLQVTYENHPLYLHAGNRPGSLNGDHTQEYGGRWYVMPVSGVKRG